MASNDQPCFELGLIQILIERVGILGIGLVDKHKPAGQNLGVLNDVLRHHRSQGIVFKVNLQGRNDRLLERLLPGR